MFGRKKKPTISVLKILPKLTLPVRSSEGLELTLNLATTYVQLHRGHRIRAAQFEDKKTGLLCIDCVKVNYARDIPFVNPAMAEEDLMDDLDL
jgi:hypothetical protein